MMSSQHLARRLAARKLAADRLATDLILDCERAASGRNGKRVDPARWTDTDWRSYVRAAARSPATSRLAPLYHAIGDIEAAPRSVDAEPRGADPSLSRPSPNHDTQRLP
jgi:hypothetical protein